MCSFITVIVFLACLSYGTCLSKETVELSDNPTHGSRSAQHISKTISLHSFADGVGPHEHVVDESVKPLATLLLATNRAPVHPRLPHAKSKKVDPTMHERQGLAGQGSTAAKVILNSAGEDHAQNVIEAARNKASELNEATVSDGTLFAHRVPHLRMSETDDDKDDETAELEKRFKETAVAPEDITDADKRDLIRGVGGFLIFVGLCSCLVGGAIWEPAQNPAQNADEVEVPFGLAPTPSKMMDTPPPIPDSISATDGS